MSPFVNFLITLIENGEKLRLIAVRIDANKLPEGAQGYFMEPEFYGFWVQLVKEKVPEYENSDLKIAAILWIDGVVDCEGRSKV